MAKQARWIYPESKPQDILEMAKQRLQSRSECLVIFDNVEERAAIEPYLPVVGAEPHLLLTSRTFQEGFDRIDILLLDDECSFQLLLKESRRNIDSLPEPEQKAAGEIAGTLGGLPLAIEIAGAYLKYINTCTFQSYKGFLAENLKEAMKGDSLSSFTKHEKDLFLTLQVSKPELARAPLLNDILDILAWSGAAFMGVSLLAALLGKREAELFTPLHLGVSLHLLQKTPEGERYDIHRLVRRVRQEQCPIAQREQWIKDTCQRLGDWFEERNREFTHLPAFEAEMDHLKQWLDNVNPYSSNHSARLTWLQQFPPSHWGKYREAQRLVQSAFTLLSENSEEDPKLKANILYDLGIAYNKLGEFPKALENHMQALKIRQQFSGEQYLDKARSFNSVGITYSDLGDHKKALEYMLRALEIRQQLSGEQHYDTAASFNNVGITYGDLGDHKKALEYKLRALNIQQKTFGEQHPHTAIYNNNIGTTYGYLGDHEKALGYRLRALDIQKQLLGEHHPDTAVTLQNLIYSLMKLKRFQEAGERLDEYLERLPQDHPMYENLSGLKKTIQNEKRKGLHGIPGKKKKKR